MRDLRLAVLLCDEIILRVVRNDYGNIFHQYLSSSLKLITPNVTFTLDTFDVVGQMDYPPDDVHYDGILISGSRASVDVDLEWTRKLLAYVKHIMHEKPLLKLFGICFGHQIIAKALGADVVRGDWEVAVETVYLTRIGRAIFHADRLNLQLIHHDQVLAPPPHAHLLGVSEEVDNQGFVLFHRGHGHVPLPADIESQPDPEAASEAVRASWLRGIHVLTLQGHPELTERVMRQLIHSEAAELGPELVEDALARVSLPTDALDKVGRVIWGVLGVTTH